MVALVVPVEATDRVTQTVTQMYSCVSKSHSSHGTGQVHVLACLVVLWVLYSTLEVLSSNMTRVSRPNITQRVASLKLCDDIDYEIYVTISQKWELILHSRTE